MKSSSVGSHNYQKSLIIATIAVKDDMWLVYVIGRMIMK